MKLPNLQIGDLKAQIPIIQGGMAIRISMAPLAAAVAEEGGIGLIAASGLDVEELRQEIRAARALTKGIIGINIMFAASNFSDIVQAAIEEKIDLIVSGAGFSRDIFTLGQKADVPIIPIVSTPKLAKIAEKLGAAAVIVEGKEAGGHLGTEQSLLELIPLVKKEVNIPVIAAGGIVDGKDLAQAFLSGADGAQLGLRFAASHESSAAPSLKDYYVKAGQEDLILIDSPVGYPARALRNDFTERLAKEKRIPPLTCRQCLKKCSHNFCIIEALSKAQQGDLVNGLVFTGEGIDKITAILSVKEIIHTLLSATYEFFS
ncbi:MAG: nitronate monooxygenase [Peptococcia bacterium]